MRKKVKQINKDKNEKVYYHLLTFHNYYINFWL